MLAEISNWFLSMFFPFAVDTWICSGGKWELFAPALNMSAIFTKIRYYFLNSVFLPFAWLKCHELKRRMIILIKLFPRRDRWERQRYDVVIQVAYVTFLIPRKSKIDSHCLWCRTRHAEIESEFAFGLKNHDTTSFRGCVFRFHNADSLSEDFAGLSSLQMKNPLYLSSCFLPSLSINPFLVDIFLQASAKPYPVIQSL